ncbi:uncharacterized protein LOC143264993 [Megachile rotundata]|uniref:uncharacterized protein LOC143264993 n=1 Tax=Megachile rotundata TaxID=143995 RepID=UPI003FD100A7
MPSQPAGTQKTTPMELRSRQTEPMSEDVMAMVQKQQIEKERRLREEARMLDSERRELEEARLRNEALLARIRKAEQSQGAIPRKRDIPEELPTEMEVPSVAVVSESIGYTLNEAVKMVPVFNGSSPTLLTFTRACKRARQLIPAHAEGTLVKLIIGHLSGHAAAAVEDEEIYTVAELCNTLKDIFGPQRTVDHYRGELASIYMKNGEHVLDFITRVKDLRDAILDCDRGAPNIDEINNFAKGCFIDGLMSPMRLEVKAVAAEPLKCVFREAISAFKRLELEKSRQGRTEVRRVNFEQRDGTPDWRSSRDFRRNESPRRVDFGRRDQNSEWRERRFGSPPRRDSWKPTSPVPPRNYQANRGFTRYPRGDDRRDPPLPDRFCRYCNIPGHDLHECRKRRYNEQMRNSRNEQALPPATNKGREGPSTKTVHAVTLDHAESTVSIAGEEQQTPKSE